MASFFFKFLFISDLPGYKTFLPRKGKGWQAKSLRALAYAQKYAYKADFC